MKIELSPSTLVAGKAQGFTAQFTKASELIAEIKDAPHDIAVRWAEIMKELHDDLPEIKRIGICLYCGSINRKDKFCGDCKRVFRS